MQTNKRIEKYLNKLFYAFILALIITFAGVTVANWWDAVSIPSEGNVSPVNTVAGVEVYLDEQLTQKITSLAWGSIERNIPYTKTFYILNTGNATATYFIAYIDWNPVEAEPYFNISWNYTGAYVKPNESICVTITLTVSESIQNITEFSYTTFIQAEKV